MPEPKERLIELKVEILKLKREKKELEERLQIEKTNNTLLYYLFLQYGIKIREGE